MANKIFISIACLMDKDVLNTIEDCLKKAKNRDNIIFGICLQYDPEDNFIKEYDNNPQFRIHKMHWNQAKGPTMARYYCCQLIQNEEYFLQIDCHTRFYPNWDIDLINELHKCEKINPKSVISHYPLNIKNMNNPKFTSHIGHIATYRYINTDSIKSHGSLHRLPTEPKPSHGIMAAMIFTRCKTLKEVPYDPKFYFGYHAEEQFFYAVRLWTHGYTSFTPTKHTLAMEYVTNGQRVPNQVRSHVAGGASKWNQKTWRKCKYYLRLDSLENVDCEEYKHDILHNQNKYGLGNERNVIDYFKMTNLQSKMLELFPFYKEYCKLEDSNKLTHMLECYNLSKDIAVVTQNTPNLIGAYFKEVRENHIAYCKKHNYTYYSFYENLAEEVKRGESPKVCWSKAKACLDTIKNHKVIMWIDADAIFANMEIKIEDRINQYPDKDFYLSKDPKTHFINSGVMIWKNTELSNYVVNKWWNSEHIPYGKGGDQLGLGNVIKKENITNWHHFEERELNCYPSNYHPYDYIIHFMGVKSKININDRIKRWNSYNRLINEDPKIYFSLTTVPERYENLPQIIDKLLENTVKPTKIIFSIPKKYLLFNMDYCHLTKIKNILKNYIDDGYLEINEVENGYGPATKYTGIINYIEKKDLIHKENFAVIIVDDDLLYNKNIIQDYLKKYAEKPRSILTFYHMSNSNIKANHDLGSSLIIKGADSIFIPKYFFIQNTNPSLEETLKNAVANYKDCIFDDDRIITTFFCYKHCEKISIFKGERSYTYPKTNTKNNFSVSKNNQNKFNRNDTPAVLHDFYNYYNYDKYSNVKFCKYCKNNGCCFVLERHSKLNLFCK